MTSKKNTAVSAVLMDMRYSSGAGKLCLQFGDKKAKRYKTFTVVDPAKPDTGDYTALINLQQNKITLTQKADKQKTELASPVFAIALKALKEQVAPFYANKQGLLHLHLVTEGDLTAPRKQGEAARPCQELT